MTPKNKAEYLVDEYYQLICESIANGKFEISKDCALILVNEIIDNCDNTIVNEFIKRGAISYWNEVKQELENV